MSLADLLRTAVHSLRVNPIRSMLAIMGVVFGIAAVVVLISMGQGVRGQISDQIRGMGTDLLIVKSGQEEDAADRNIRPDTGSGTLSGSTLTAEDVTKVRQLKKHVSGATGAIETPAPVQSMGDNPKALNVNIIGGDDHFLTVRKLKFSKKADGWTYDAQTNDTCAIGSSVKEALFGRDVPNSEVIDKEIRVNGRVMKVKAVVAARNKSLFQDPNREVYVTLHDARQMLAGADSNKVVQVYAKARNASQVKEARKAIIDAIDSVHKAASDGNGQEYCQDFHVATQDDLMASYSKILSILNALVIGVALVALTESGIGVSNIMYIAVKERTREIGVRLAQGASSRAILIQFLFESITLCLLGAAIGIPLGWAVAALINEYTVLPAQTPLWAVFVAFAAALLVGVTAGVYPAWKATKADIAVVLRSE